MTGSDAAFLCDCCDLVLLSRVLVTVEFVCAFVLQSGASAVAADYFSAPVVQAAQVYDPAKAYYAPVAAVAQAPSATVYTLPVDATAVYQAAKYPQIYDTAPKKYYPVAAAAPSAIPTTMYTAVPAEPVYQTRAFSCHFLSYIILIGVLKYSYFCTSVRP